MVYTVIGSLIISFEIVRLSGDSLSIGYNCTRFYKCLFAHKQIRKSGRKIDNPRLSMSFGPTAQTSSSTASIMRAFHPLIRVPYFYPPLDQIVGKCGKFQLLGKLPIKVFARKYTVLILSQWTKILDIMDFYFSEEGFKVRRIDDNVKLDERGRQS
ncbi:hypothetical protein RND81_06G157700 [Saponaria officinalis]|uniref:Uncharacterized protein n=1 Tax=Saponaria officinalis TaxID=3572 RepID=A0AAW1KAZ2_SAPOF